MKVLDARAGSVVVDLLVKYIDQSTPQQAYESFVDTFLRQQRRDAIKLNIKHDMTPTLDLLDDDDDDDNMPATSLLLAVVVPLVLSLLVIGIIVALTRRRRATTSGGKHRQGAGVEVGREAWRENVDCC